MCYNNGTYGLGVTGAQEPPKLLGVGSNPTVRAMPYKDAEKQKQAQQKHYRENKDKVYRASRSTTLKKRKLVYEYKESKPCADCNNFYPHYVMDLDHKDPSKKDLNIAQMITRRGIVKLQEELEKCEVVCANCHRERTQRQKEAGIIN